jgi:membrane protein implicated in regulation of membrane protease activity
MHLVYLITAAVGCTLLAAQLGLQLLGLGGDAADVGHGDLGDLGDGHVGGLEIDHVGDLDHADAGQSNLFFGILSFKTLTAFLAFFGLSGLACEELGLESEPLILAISTTAGLSSAVVVAMLMRLLVGLQSSGTLDLRRAIGKTAKVYLRVPGQMSGSGKIHVIVDGREVELNAMTRGDEVPTGALVEVVQRLDGATFEVMKT